MKVLFIGHYKESGGWSQASTDYILALDSIGVDVVCRDVKLTGTQIELPNRIRQLEEKTTDNCDYCIQHLLPHHLVGSDAFKANVAILDTESEDIKSLAWFDHLKKMDAVFTANNEMTSSLHDNGYGLKNVKTIYHTHDIEKYTRSYPDIKIPEAEGKFKFYYIGDLNDRKNLISVIKCFHSEFDHSDNAILMLKVNKFGLSPEQLGQEVHNLSNRAKESLRMYPNLEDYMGDVIIPERYTEQQIYSLHQYGDCFVCPSHGEAWSIPSFEAMAFGSTPICSRVGGPIEFIGDTGTGSLVGGTTSICDCSDSAFVDMFTGREYWFTPSEKQIREKMRYYYDNRKPIDYKIAGLQRANNFCYKDVAETIMSELGVVK